MSEAVWSWYQPQPWRYGFIYTLQVTLSPQIWGQPGRCNGIRVQPYTLETAYQWLKHSSYALHGCMKWSEVNISLNHDIMASFLLHKWPWVLINSSECMKWKNIHVVTKGITLGGEYDAIRMWLYGVAGKSIVCHQSVTSQKHQNLTLYPITLAVSGFFQQKLTCEVI